MGQSRTGTPGDGTDVRAGEVRGCCGAQARHGRGGAQGCQGRMVTGTPAQGWGRTHPVLAASFLEGAQQHGSVAALLEVGGHVLPGDAGRPALVGAGHGVPGTLVLVVLGREDGHQPGPGASGVRVPVGPVSPGWCRRRTPWRSRCRAGCAWGTRPGHAGTAGAASCGPHTCSHSTRSPGDMCPGGPGDHGSIVTLQLPMPASPARDGAMRCPPWPGCAPHGVPHPGSVPMGRLCPHGAL